MKQRIGYFEYGQVYPPHDAPLANGNGPVAPEPLPPARPRERWPLLVTVYSIGALIVAGALFPGAAEPAAVNVVIGCTLAIVFWVLCGALRAAGRDA